MSPASPASPAQPEHPGSTGPGEVTRLLGAVRAGDADALDRLFPVVYDELRRIAAGQLRRHAAAPTLHATSLVHDAYLKLAGGDLSAENRAHFLAIAARAMKQVLIDQARREGAGKRGGGWQQTTLADGHASFDLRLDDVLALERAMEQLDPRQRQIVEYRFFAGMEEAEVAEVLGVSDRTVRREWVKARAWLFRSLMPEA